MNDKPPSTSGTGGTGLLARMRRALKASPWSREEIQELTDKYIAHIDEALESKQSEIMQV